MRRWMAMKISVKVMLVGDGRTAGETGFQVCLPLVTLTPRRYPHVTANHRIQQDPASRWHQSISQLASSAQGTPVNRHSPALQAV